MEDRRGSLTSQCTFSKSRVQLLESSNRKPRLAVVSPFLDKSHGTERMVVEWLEHLADAYEIHVYSQQISDVDPSKIVFHRISKLSGPHLFNFLWWFWANQRARRRDRSRNLTYDVVYSPGTNCLDADAVTVHVIFAEYVRRVRRELEFKNNRITLWPLLLHRRLYYRVVMFFERRVFRKPQTQLVLTAQRSAADLRRFYARNETLPVVPVGIDHTVFNPSTRTRLREDARTSLRVDDTRFALLLVGNDLRNKGLPALIEAINELRDLPIDLLVVGQDDPGPFVPTIREKSLERRVRFLPPRKDVEFYYAAADAYVGPSLEDTFALPASEAMACGLPVIISSRAGASSLITHGDDGFILDDPTDAKKLATAIRSLYEDSNLCDRIGRNAVATASKYTWARSAQELSAVFQQILARKAKATETGTTPEPAS
jgi:glycosyltransferase involved in cell wall biosynthesis